MKSLRAAVLVAVSVVVLAVGSCGGGSGSGGQGGAGISGSGGAAGAVGQPQLCGAGQALCAGRCASISLEDDRCGPGACAVACAGAQHCTEGTCQLG